jgi:type IV pilus assembly protein PilW
MAHIFGGCGGFTLIEMLIVLVMSTILMGAIMTTTLSLRRSYTTQEVAADIQQDVRMAMEFMARDIREAGLDPMGVAGTGFERADSNFVRITMDRVANGSIDNDNFERVSYYRDPGDDTLKIRLYENTIAQSTAPLAEDISNLTFTYFDGDGNITATLTDIVSVGISLTARAPAGRGGTLERTYTALVRCRNQSLLK